MTEPKEAKAKWTVSVSPIVAERLERYVTAHGVNRSSIVEQALELWLTHRVEQEEEAYFAASADEMNADAKSWTAITTKSTKKAWK